jgi:hypothetical protein
MKKSNLLIKVKNTLRKSYHIDWQEWNVIDVQVTKDGPVFGFFVFDPERPNSVIFSVALDAGDVFTASDIVLKASKVVNLELGEGFYVTQDEQILWGENAVLAMAIESGALDMESSPSKHLN